MFDTIDCKTRIIKRLRLTVSICSLMMLVCVTAQASNTEKSYPPPFDTFNLTWQKVLIDHGKVIQVGSQRLPYPIVLPESVTPLGMKAMVRQSYKPDSTIGFEMYFSVKDEARIRPWAEGAAHHFPVLIGKYQIVRDPSLHVTYNTWLYRLVVQNKDTKVLFVASVYPSRPSVDKLNPNPIEDTWASSESPVKNEPAYIGIRVYYAHVNHK